MHAYASRWKKSTGYFSLNVSSTRGCPFKCNWCAKPIYGNRYQARSAHHLIEELRFLHKQYHFDHIWFTDDIFGLKPGWVQEFASLMQRESFRLKYKIQARADLLLAEGVIESLAQSGCEEVWIGAESGSQKILDAMDKGISVQQVHQVSEKLKAHGIKPCFFLQFGYPGEEVEDIRATLKMVFDIMPHNIGVSVSYPLPGTKFYARVKVEMGLKTNWKDSDELAVMFQSTYPPEFYRKLQRYVHREFRKRQAVQSLQHMLVKPLDTSFRQFVKACSLSFRLPQSAFSKSRVQKYVAGI
jgi:radical SAM superfamily enzyme YgiQ (UPF0313 family)